MKIVSHLKPFVVAVIIFDVKSLGKFQIYNCRRRMSNAFFFQHFVLKLCQINLNH